MKEYGEYFVNEDGSWLARWYVGNKVEDETTGKESTVEEAHTKGAAWVKAKGNK